MGMIERVVKINNIGRFREYIAKGDVTFRKLTLIYAENGCGKTTLCAILRSLQSGRPEFIAERKTLGTAEEPYVHVRINNSDYKFSNGAWTGTYSNILIFDPVFVNENVHSGEYVEHEHKKNIYRVIVGAEGVRLAREIEELDRQIREANSDLRHKRELVSIHLPDGVRLEDFLGWKLVADIETEILKKSEELNALQRAKAKAGEIQTKGLFEKIQLPSLPSDYFAVLARQLEDVVADAELKLRQQILRHRMGHKGESWLSQGLSFIQDDLCPFCGKDLRENDLIASYHSYFSEAYRSLKQEVAELAYRANNSIGEASLVSVQQAIAGNAALVEFWRQFHEVDLPVISFLDIQQKYAIFRDRCISLARKKQDRPIDEVSPGEEFEIALSGVAQLQEVVVAYNAAVEDANVRVVEQKTTTHLDGDLQILKDELSKLEALKKRSRPEVAECCRAYIDAVTAKEGLEQRKAVTRLQLDRHCQDILQVYEQAINKYLDHFNTGFRITNTRHLYTGGTPSSQYQIEINNTPLDLGDIRTPLGTPCFRTALSAGDRSALALAFFLAVIKQDADIERKSVVFDDPFTSLDRFRRTCTQQLIQQLVSSAQQVLVLSHDAQFVKLLCDECPSAATIVKTLQVSKTGNTTVIGEWDVQAEVQSPYMKDFSALQEFYSVRRGDPRAIARTIRPFLEGMLRSHFPGHFQPNEWLGDFIGKIRSANESSGLQHAKAEVDELDAINNYSRKYPHRAFG
jgi:wobble nucleotide-excising tRNase